jgi:hypothetical protein
LFSNDVKPSSPVKGEWSRFKAMFFTLSFGGVGGWSEPNETNFFWKKTVTFWDDPLVITFVWFWVLKGVK